jgi:hypothetical protein
VVEVGTDGLRADWPDFCMVGSLCLTATQGTGRQQRRSRYTTIRLPRGTVNSKPVSLVLISLVADIRSD